MKKRIGVAVVVILALGLFVGCNNNAKSTTDEMADSISFTATIDEVSDTELLVTVLDNESFNQARVNMQGFDSLDFVPKKGQTVKLTIKNQVGMSEPPFVNPITITVADYQARNERPHEEAVDQPMNEPFSSRQTEI